MLYVAPSLAMVSCCLLQTDPLASDHWVVSVGVITLSASSAWDLVSAALSWCGTSLSQNLSPPQPSLQPVPLSSPPLCDPTHPIFAFTFPAAVILPDQARTSAAPALLLSVGWAFPGHSQGGYCMTLALGTGPIPLIRSAPLIWTLMSSPLFTAWTRVPLWHGELLCLGGWVALAPIFSPAAKNQVGARTFLEVGVGSVGLFRHPPPSLHPVPMVGEEESSLNRARSRYMQKLPCRRP